jgi:hypothetical protein
MPQPGQTPLTPTDGRSEETTAEGVLQAAAAAAWRRGGGGRGLGRL